MKKIKLAFFVILFISNCQMDPEPTAVTQTNFPFYVGTYTNGDSQGIYKYLLTNDGKLQKIGLVAKSDNPSFLTKSADNKYLIAVNETDKMNGSGSVESYRIQKDTLSLLSQRSSGGAHPCFVAINPKGMLLVANYTGGNIGLLKLNENGSLSELLDVEQHEGIGTTERQTSSHAHSAWFHPTLDLIISVDLGTNELWYSKLNKEQTKLLPESPAKLKMNPGAGPRHLTFHPNNNWVYVLNELDCTVSHLELNAVSNYVVKNNTPMLPNSFTEKNTGADIHISSDGNFLYASNRGHNSIAIFEVNNADGSLKPIGHEPTRGLDPRNFSLSPDDEYLLVANQNSDNIISFKRDKETGLLKLIDKIAAPTPVCILF